MISDPGSTRGSSSRRVKASILPSPICSRVANRLEGEHCEMWDAPPAPPDPPTGSTTHQRDPRPHLQKSRTLIDWHLLTRGSVYERLAEHGHQIIRDEDFAHCYSAVSYTHLRAHETVLDLVCRLLLEKKKN